MLTFELYPAARPEAMTLVRGQVSAPDGSPLQANVTVHHGSPTDMTYPTDSQGRFVILISLQRANRVTLSAPGHRTAVLTGTQLNQTPLTVTLQRQ